MNTVLQRLLKYPHSAVFDLDPAASLALRLRHPAGARWSISDEVLTATAGGQDYVYPLADVTVGQLAAALVADGFTVPTLSTQWAGRSALVLAEGSGDEGQSNGDRVHAFTSILWALLAGYAAELRIAEAQVKQALRQMVLHQSELEWLDLWGTLYGVPRNDGEQDAAYGPRIIREVLRLRVSGHGIEKAIHDETGADVRIEEPWRDLFILDQSALSGHHRIYDGEKYGYHLIRPVALEPVDSRIVMPIVDRNRAAGITVLDMRGLYSVHIDAGVSGESVCSNEHLATGQMRYEDRVLLDFMLVEDVPILNHEARHLRIPMRRSQVVIDPAEYVVSAAHFSTYRIIRSGVEYSSRYWSEDTWLRMGGDWDDTTIVRSS